MKYIDIESAFDFANGSEVSDNYAYISKTTGKIYYISDICEEEDDIPEDISEDEDYLAFPDKQDLGLGQYVVWEFVRNHIPDSENEVRGYFRKAGAYARYKDFLDRNDLLQKWYDFENAMIKEALLKWCEDNGIKLEGEQAGLDNGEQPGAARRI